MRARMSGLFLVSASTCRTWTACVASRRVPSRLAGRSAAALAGSRAFLQLHHLGPLLALCALWDAYPCRTDADATGFLHLCFALAF